MWDLDHKSRTFVHLMNSMTWKTITGNAPPGVPPTASLYARYNLPWYDYYSDGPALGATSETNKIKSVAELSEDKGFTIYPENESVEIKNPILIIKPTPNTVKDGSW